MTATGYGRQLAEDHTYIISKKMLTLFHVPTSFRITSLVVGILHDSSSANEIIMNDKKKTEKKKAKQSNHYGRIL